MNLCPSKRNVTLRWLFFLSVGALAGCAGPYKPPNQPVATLDTNSGYRLYSEERPLPGSHMVALAFSGGGTRAAALSYGVMQELRDTYIDTPAGRGRLLDEVDTISGVSGGSFTAAYYGLFGDRLFEDYEHVFLRRSVQGALLRRMLSPGHWARSLFSGFDRTEMAVDFYDRTVFQGKTFADLSRTGGPFIEINATELRSGRRFSFTQSMFDEVCSTVDNFPVARAVTASSAVPILFPSIVLQNHGRDCFPTDMTGSERHLARSAGFHTDEQPAPFLHLVDGGISDNLGLRAIIDRVELAGGIASSLQQIEQPQKDVLVVLVNAAVTVDRPIGRSPKKPGVSATLDAVTDAQIRQHSEETRNLVRQQLETYQATLAAQGTAMRFHFVEISFDAVQQRAIRDYLNRLPTSLALSNEQIDALISAGRTLLRDHPEYQAFLHANNGVLKERQTASACNPLRHPGCLLR
jgi:NTE family protein